VKHTRLRAALAAALILVMGGWVAADDREEPVDILIALDKSLSMEEEIEAVKEYVNSQIVDSLLQNGDFFLIIAFYGQTNIIVSDYIKGEEHKGEIKGIVSAVEADGRFTDIGNALDTLKSQVEKYSSPDRRKTLLLITDGKHEPPPESKYYSEDGSYSHEYLEVTSETQKEGWKIIVIGLGDPAARELAEALSAEYAETEGPSAAGLKELIPDLTGVMTVVGEPDFTPVNRKNRASLRLRVRTEDFTEPPVVGIGGVRLQTAEHVEDDILTAPVAETLETEGEADITLDLELDGTLPAGSYQGTLVFDFSSKEHFEEELAVSFRVKSFIASYPWIIPVGIVAAAAVLLLLYLLLRMIGKGRKVTFRLVVEENPLKKGKDVFTARLGKPLYIKESMDVIDVADKKTTNAVAALTLTEGGLALNPIREERFPGLKAAKKNVLGESCIIRTESGKDYHVTFEQV